MDRRRTAKDGKARAKRPLVRKAPKDADTKVRDLEARLAASLEREKATGALLQAKTGALTEALEQQTATAEILRVISASPSDVEPVFRAIARSATRICDARFGTVFRFDGERISVGAHHDLTPEEIAVTNAVFPAPATRGTAAGRAIVERRVVHIPDIRRDVDYLARAPVATLGYRTALAVPLLRDGNPLGVFVMWRREVRPFTDEQIELVQTFADQAVIAIENVRLFTELQARNRDLAATSEILRVIASSPTEVRPVFEAIVRTAHRLLGGHAAALLHRVGDDVHLGAYTATRSDGDTTLTSRYPVPIGELPPALARVLLDGEVDHIPDTEDPAVSDWARSLARARGHRSRLAVPLRRGGTAIGALNVTRAEPRPFSEDDIALLQTFADQAVIAIENVRLFTELQARNRDLTTALDTQTATSDILRVISGARTDVQPVFDAILSSAVRLLGGYTGALTRVTGDQIDLAAFTSLDEAADALLRAAFPQPVGGRSGPHPQAIRDRAPLNFTDAQTASQTSKGRRAVARARGYRSQVVVPLLRRDEAIGTISITRREAGGFSTDETALLQTFADQAVIAIENARLLSELQEKNEALTRAHAQVTEALEQQTATAEILKVISRSPTDVQPVFDTIADSVMRLCDAWSVAVYPFDGELVHVTAARGGLPDSASYLKERYPMRPTPEAPSLVVRAIVERTIVHVPDAELDDRPGSRETGRARGYRAAIAVPMLRGGEPIGGIGVSRVEPGAFSPAQIDVLKTFADQAVIAIENVRLFAELQTSNRELTTALDTQTATSDILRVISGSRTDVQPVFDAIVRSAVRLLGGYSGALTRVSGSQLDLAALTSTDAAEDAALRARFPQALAALGPHAEALRTRAAVNIGDSQTDPRWEAEHAYARVRGYRSATAVPLLRHDQAIGIISVNRREAGGFTGDEIALLQTFADQAVIAIENARLLTELQDRNAALTEANARVTAALDQQTATGEILKVIASSPTDARPVFDTIVRSAVRLCNGLFSALFQFDGERLHQVAQHNYTHEALEEAQRIFPARPTRALRAARAILDRAVVHVPDVELDPEPQPPALGRAIGYRAVLCVPMLREGAPIGVISVGGAEPGPFSDTQIALLQTFADQAVIAIENVRLFTELQTSNRELTAALDTQTATSDILRVISGSRTDVQPVFDAIVQSAVRLLRGDSGMLARVRGDELQLAALTSTDPAGDAAQRARFPQALDAEGPVPLAVRNRAPINMADAQSDPRMPEASRAIARARGSRSRVVVPLLRHGEAIGVIAVARHEAGGFTDDEIALLQTFADQAVIAIENARLLTELQARTEDLTRSVGELRALGEIGQAIGSTLDLQTVLATIVARATELAGADAGLIYEYDAEREVFEPRAAERLEDEIMRALATAPVRRGMGTTGRLAEVREPIQRADLRTAREEQTPVLAALLRAGYRALLAVPLVRDENLIGSLTVFRKTPGEYPADVVALLQTFATQSALAIQNARLFREIEIKSRQLEVASRHKSEFLANMSHELRTPLNAIIGYSELLEEEAGDVDGGRLVPDLQKIATAAKHQLSLINDILDLSKIEAGRMELEPAEFDLPRAMDNALTLVRERATRRGIALGSTIDGSVGSIHGDERKVKQVLLNLLSNALKFTPEGGRIDVTATVSEGLVEVSVADSGVGIAPEDQEAVFEEFRQVGRADRKVEGTGLGLTLCKKFVELHGGWIRVRSQVGAGSTFTFTLPVRPEGRADPSAPVH